MTFQSVNHRWNKQLFVMTFFFLAEELLCNRVQSWAERWHSQTPNETNWWAESTAESIKGAETSSFSHRSDAGGTNQANRHSHGRSRVRIWNTPPAGVTDRSPDHRTTRSDSWDLGRPRRQATQRCVVFDFKSRTVYLRRSITGCELMQVKREINTRETSECAMR